MAEREQRRRSETPHSTEEAEAASSPASTERAERLKGELDDLLDEID